MKCGHKGRLHKGNFFILKDLVPYQVQCEYMYCHKCKKKELSEEEKQRIKTLIDEEEAKNEKN